MSGFFDSEGPSAISGGTSASAVSTSNSFEALLQFGGASAISTYPYNFSNRFSAVKLKYAVNTNFQSE